MTRLLDQMITERSRLSIIDGRDILEDVHLITPLSHRREGTPAALASAAKSKEEGRVDSGIVIGSE